MARSGSSSRDSISNTLIVAISLSLVCSVVVSATAVSLKPLQERNAREYQQRIILDVAGLSDPSRTIEESFGSVDVRLVDLATGEYVDDVDPKAFDAVAAANDPAMSVAIPEDLDIAGIRRRAVYAQVHIVSGGDGIEQVILPVHGSGLWSTMYGYLALEPDGTTVRGLRFYEHEETPGLGDQIEDPQWLAQWPGKRLFGDDGQPVIEVVRGTVQPGAAAVHQVDGLSGATLTGRGVANLLRYWTGPHGFGPYLEKLRNDENE